MIPRPNVIAIIQPFVPSYRRPLFDAIDAELRTHGLVLEVWHDFPKGRVAARGNADRGRWSVLIKQHRVSIGRRNITYRSVGREARAVRAVIAGLASTNIETYLLALDPRVCLMLWGHGRNFTASNTGLDATIEAWLAKRSSHIFTYTDDGKESVMKNGLSSDDITVVVNTTDTTTLRDRLLQTTHAESADIRERQRLGPRKVVLFVGALDAPKELPFLFEAMDLVHADHPDMTFVIAGAGPEEAQVREMADARSYARMIGRLEPDQLAPFATVVDLVAMPGRVGLVAVDTLALGLPVVTTTYAFHAPEAAYLTDGVDSVWTSFDVAAYAAGVSNLLRDEEKLRALSAASFAKGAEFSVQSSARRFVDGILKALTA